MFARLRSVRAALPLRRRRLESAKIRRQMAIGRRAARKFVPDENSELLIRCVAATIELRPLPANLLRRGMRPIPLKPRANINSRPRRRIARSRLAGKSLAAPPPKQRVAGAWRKQARHFFSANVDE